MGSMTRCAVSALWIVVFALGVRSPAQDGEIYRLGVPARAGQGEGPLDWVYERVATSGDSWSGESSSEEVKAALGWGDFPWEFPTNRQTTTQHSDLGKPPHNAADRLPRIMFRLAMM